MTVFDRVCYTLFINTFGFLPDGIEFVDGQVIVFADQDGYVFEMDFPLVDMPDYMLRVSDKVESAIDEAYATAVASIA